MYGKKFGGVIGALAGMTIMLTDIGKGVLIVYFARDIFGFPEVLTLVSAIIGMAGHNWPVWFKFRKGGKGIALLGGALLMLHPLSFLSIIPMALALPMIKRLSGLVPFAVIPVYILANLIYQQTGIENLDSGAINTETIGLLFGSLLFIYGRRIDAEKSILKKQPSKLKALWYLLIYDRATNDPPPL